MVTQVAIRPRSTTEILDAAFQLFRRAFVPLVMLGAIGFLPFMAITVGFLAVGNTPEPAVFVALFIFFLPALLWYSVADAAMILVTSEMYRERPISPGAALRTVLPQAGRILLASLGKYGFMFGGFIVFVLIGSIISALLGLVLKVSNSTVFIAIFSIILVLFSFAWMLYAASRFFAVPAAVVLENIGARAAISRTRALSLGVTGRICKVLVLTALLIGIAVVVVSIAVIIPFGAASLAANVLSSLFNMLIYPFFSVVTALLYYDVRVRKEGYDLELMEQDLSAQVTTA